MSSSVSPDSVEKENRTSAFFPSSVPRPSTSTRTSPNAVPKDGPRDVSANRTFPPVNRMESTVNFWSFAPGSSFGATVSPFSSTLLSFCFLGSKDKRFNIPLRSMETLTSGSCTCRAVKRKSRAARSEGKITAFTRGRRTMVLLSLPETRNSFRIKSPCAERVGGLSLYCLNEMTAFTSRKAEGISYSRCKGTYSR